MSKKQDRNDTVTLFFSWLSPHSCSVGPVLLLEEISSFIHSLVFNQKSSTHLNPQNTHSPVIIRSSIVYSSKLPTLFKTQVLLLPQLQPVNAGRAAPPPISSHFTPVYAKFSRDTPTHLTTATWALLLVPAFSGESIITPPLASGQLDTSSTLSKTCQDLNPTLPAPQTFWIHNLEITCLSLNSHRMPCYF